MEKKALTQKEEEKIIIATTTSTVEKLSELLFRKKTTKNKPVLMNIIYKSGINEAGFNKIISEINNAFLDNESVIDRKIYVSFDTIEF